MKIDRFTIFFVLIMLFLSIGLYAEMIDNKYEEKALDVTPPPYTTMGNYGCIPYETAVLSGERLPCGCIDQTKYTNEYLN